MAVRDPLTRGRPHGGRVYPVFGFDFGSDGEHPAMYVGGLPATNEDYTRTLIEDGWITPAGRCAWEKPATLASLDRLLIDELHQWREEWCRPSPLLDALLARRHWWHRLGVWLRCGL